MASNFADLYIKHATLRSIVNFTFSVSENDILEFIYFVVVN